MFFLLYKRFFCPCRKNKTPTGKNKSKGTAVAVPLRDLE